MVAEEVQRLAENSRNATQQIATLVSNIQVETNETINTVNRTIGQVVEGSAQAQKAGEQMRRTQEITAQLVANVRNIARVSEQQKAMSAGLLEAVREMDDSTEQTARQIEVQNEQTDALLQASHKLVESVNVFKLPVDAAASADVVPDAIEQVADADVPEEFADSALDVLDEVAAETARDTDSVL